MAMTPGRQGTAERTMSDIARTDELFFARTGMDPERVGRIVGEALEGTDDGELFLEYRPSAAITFDDGRVRNASLDTSQGFGLRAVADHATGHAPSTEVRQPATRRPGAPAPGV